LKTVARRAAGAGGGRAAGRGGCARAARADGGQGGGGRGRGRVARGRAGRRARALQQPVRQRRPAGGAGRVCGEAAPGVSGLLRRRRLAGRLAHACKLSIAAGAVCGIRSELPCCRRALPLYARPLPPNMVQGPLSKGQGPHDYMWLAISEVDASLLIQNSMSHNRYLSPSEASSMSLLVQFTLSLVAQTTRHIASNYVSAARPQRAPPCAHPPRPVGQGGFDRSLKSTQSSSHGCPCRREGPCCACISHCSAYRVNTSKVAMHAAPGAASGVRAAMRTYCCSNAPHHTRQVQAVLRAARVQEATREAPAPWQRGGRVGVGRSMACTWRV